VSWSEVGLRFGHSIENHFLFALIAEIILPACGASTNIPMPMLFTATDAFNHSVPPRPCLYDMAQIVSFDAQTCNQGHDKGTQLSSRFLLRVRKVME
jgi:hypothetical protein